MAANKTLNLWMASTAAERNLLVAGVGLVVGDLCLVDGVGIFVVVSMTAVASTWRAIAAIPSVGNLAFGGRNDDNTLMRSVFAQSAVTFSPRLEAAPSSITIVMVANLNWPALPALVGLPTTAGFTFSGTSNLINVGLTASWRGTYTITY